VARSFSEELAEFLEWHDHASLTERITALRAQTMWLELERDEKTQRADDLAYGKQLLMPTRPRKSRR